MASGDAASDGRRCCKVDTKMLRLVCGGASMPGPPPVLQGEAEVLQDRNGHGRRCYKGKARTLRLMRGRAASTDVAAARRRRCAAGGHPPSPRRWFWKPGPDLLQAGRRRDR